MNTLKIIFVGLGGLLIAGADVNSERHRLGVLPEGKEICTGSQWDVSIQGTGFFQVIDRHGEVGYTRNGRFYPDADDDLAVGGCKITPVLHFARREYSDVAICQDGLVCDGKAGVGSGKEKVGQIYLSIFPNQDELEVRDGLYRQTPESGHPKSIAPQSAINNVGYGLLLQDFIETEQRDGNDGK